MDDKFDKKLSSRIAEVFDNYEYPPADKGWARLRQKFPEKEDRRIAWLWWSSAAAVLLLFLGIGIWLSNKPGARVNIATRSKKHPTRMEANSGMGNRAAIKPPINQNHLIPIDTIANESKKNRERGSARLGRDENYVARGYQQVKGESDSMHHYGQTNRHIKGNNAVTAPITLISSDQTNDTGIDNFNTKRSKSSKTIASIAAPDTTVASNSKITSQPATAVVPPVIVSTNVSTTGTPQPVKTIDDMFRQDVQHLKKQEGDKKDLKKVNFSVYAATYFNYAEGSNNQVNAGAGFTSDISLTKNLRLSTGVSLAQNTLSYSSTPPVLTGRAVAKAAPAIRTLGFFNASAAVAEFKNYNASLVGLDIPLNIKFEFNPQKSDAYISAGVSSGTFIDERYTYRYAYQTNGLIDKTPTTQDQTTTSNFSSFYFAKTLNFSFGIGYPIGKNRLIIEPFLKYPLSGLGTQDIRFGAGGLNLKFNFKATKKR